MGDGLVAKSKHFWSVSTRPLRRWSAWLAVFAILVQIQLPLAVFAASQSADGWTDAFVCSIHASAQPDQGGLPDDQSRQPCPLCQTHSTDRLLPPDRPMVAAFAVRVVETLPPDRGLAHTPPARVAPPAPPRGPPSVV